ncbi:MAG: alpha/beta hydrolase [Sediminibacterium magnilacihabitans]|jgi:pimeloyl-ACP methyl ester carboxylesterase|nr:alpha/beta hydrolase [Sediminibacterium magnilacihabitans]PQV62109.1 pimeloyl-ACP methyl ester carboxylesterase [Sediminibacterium magnilacihabitans]
MKNQVSYNTKSINGVNIFYREAGKSNKKTLLLLHGYPTSSHMFRDLMRDLADSYHTIAPDYPGFGRSEQPLMTKFDYTFDGLTKVIEGLIAELKLDKFSLYLMDYGAPIGWRIASKYKDRIESIILQNGCAYNEGLETFWDPIKEYWADKTNKEVEKQLEGFHSPEGLRWQYTHGVADDSLINPDNWELDLTHLRREENNSIQLQLFHDYQSNVKLYGQWQEYFRKHSPQMLIVYGKNDYIFPASGAEAFKKDVKNLEYHLFDAGHFALESHGSEIIPIIKDFLDRKVKA